MNDVIEYSVANDGSVVSTETADWRLEWVSSAGRGRYTIPHNVRKAVKRLGIEMPIAKLAEAWTLHMMQGGAFYIKNDLHPTDPSFVDYYLPVGDLQQVAKILRAFCTQLLNEHAGAV